MHTFTKLESEYLRTQLFGVKSPTRRKLEIVKPLLETELGVNAESRLVELESILAELREFGTEAEKLAVEGFATDSLEYDNLQNRAKGHSDLASAYL